MSRAPEKLVIRADADRQIGTGHVMRSLALAQAWQEAGGDVHFVALDLPSGVEERIAAEGFEIHWPTAQRGSGEDAEATVSVARRVEAQWIVADGYAFDLPWQKTVRKGGCRLLLVDDDARCPSFDVDLLLNQNAGAADLKYRLSSREASLLLGSEYALLRREFRQVRDGKKPSHQSTAKGRSVLVTMGGADPQNVTPLVVGSLAALDRSELEVIAVVGAANPRRAALDAVAQSVPYNLRIEVRPPDMPTLMKWADVAVSAAGTTTWELAYLGVPTCHVVVADNQARIAENAAQSGYTVHLGLYSDLAAERIAEAVGGLLDDVERRAAMSQAGQAAIDGQGAQRVVEAIRNLSGAGRCVSLAS